MADIVADLKILQLTRAGNPEIVDCMARAIAEIESLRRCLGIEPESFQSIGAGVPRSPHWPAIRAAKLKAQPTCEATGTREDLEVHHVEPFHENPEKELDPENLIVLSRAPHFLIAHLCSWKSHNPAVREDAAKLLKKIKSRP